MPSGDGEERRQEVCAPFHAIGASFVLEHLCYFLCFLKFESISSRADNHCIIDQKLIGPNSIKMSFLKFTNIRGCIDLSGLGCQKL